MALTATKVSGGLASLMALTIAVNLLALQGETRATRSEAGYPGAVAAPTITAASQSERPAGTSAQPAMLNPGADATMIASVQRELSNRGYPAGAADGAISVITQAAIFAYEFDTGATLLTAAPSPDLLRRIVLGSAAAASGQRSAQPVLSADAAKLVVTVKKALAANGYQAGPDDAALTPAFERAIRDYELDQRLAESGRISGPLVGRLLRIESNPATAVAAPPKTPIKPVVKPVAAKPQPVKAPTTKTTALPQRAPPPRTTASPK